jgi:hypothetical protein
VEFGVLHSAAYPYLKIEIELQLPQKRMNTNVAICKLESKRGMNGKSCYYWNGDGQPVGVDCRRKLEERD